MKQVVINVEERKYKFFMELIKNFDFITIPGQDTAKKQVLKEVAEGMRYTVLAANGKAKTRSAKSFLNEL